MQSASTIIREDNTIDQKAPLLKGVCLAMHISVYPPPLQHRVCILKYVHVIHTQMYENVVQFHYWTELQYTCYHIWLHMWLCSCLFMTCCSNIDIGVFTRNIMYLLNVKVKSIHFFHCISNIGAATIWGTVSSICYEIKYSDV